MKLFNSLARKLIGATLVVTAVAGLTGAVLAGFGPDRPTKVYNGAGTPGFDYPVFNSFTNVPGYGDERNFFTGAYPGGGPLTDPLAEVKQDDELTLQILVHNNADPKYNADGSGFARDTNVRVALPSGMAKSHQATAYITASNTNPAQIYDTLDFGSYNGGFFELEYIPGSARVRGNYIDTVVSDAIVAGGVKVGTRALDGVVEGCFGEEVLVTLKVKVKMPQYTLKKEVRLESEATNAYATEKNAKVSDTLVWKMTFNNIGRTKLDDVQFIDPLPENMSVIPGTIKVYNETNPNGYTVPDSAIQMNGRQIEMVLGDYAAGGNAFIYFKTKTDRNLSDLCETVSQKNTAFVQPKGLIAISNDATVRVATDKECVEPETPVYNCVDVKLEKLGGRKVRVGVEVSGAPANRVVFKNVEFNFGDGSTPLVTTNKSAEYTYAKDGTFRVTAKVTFAVDGVNQTVSSDACAESVTFTSTPGEKCPYNNALPKDDPNCVKPKELPYTGAGSNIAIFAVATLAGMFLFRAYALKK